MAKRTCSVRGCKKPVVAWGWCDLHYRRWLRDQESFFCECGAPVRAEGNNCRSCAARLRRLPVPIEDRLWPRIRKLSNGCWEWTGQINRQRGYGMFWANGERRVVHRFMYEYFVGPIPGGLVIDHLCHNADARCLGGPTCPHRRCVNPAHLEPTTDKENRDRAWARLTHCRAGHEFTPENTYIRRDGHRQCVVCRREASQRQQAKRDLERSRSA